MKFDVVIIGTGVIGSLTARELAKYKLNVVMLEKEDDVAMGASKANSAIVHGGFDPIPGTLKAKLNVRGVTLMTPLTEELNVPYRNNGSLVLAFSEEEMEHVRKLYDRGIANGVPDMEILDSDSLHKLEPRVSPKAVGALYAKSAGIVCPYELTIAAAGNAMDNGVTLMTNFAVDSIEKIPGGYSVRSGDREVTGTYVINCAGLFADKIARMVGDNSFELVPKKGEYMLLDRSEGDMVSRTLFQVPTAAGKGILVTPTVDNNILVGPTSVVIDDKNNKETTLEGLETIKATAAKSVENINFRAVITSFTGLRASRKDGDDFIIEESAVAKNFINVAGIDSPGLSSAPAIAEYVLGILKELGLKAEKNEKFDGHRESYHTFKHMTLEEKNEVIKRDPAYGHIICRCETVTEGEIVAAIRRNPPARSFDAVKRRVRTGMGRCQGGFCTTYVVDLLAREMGIDQTEVTKFGGDSKFLVGKTK